MKTIILPLEEYQDLITYKENWEKGLILCYVGSHAHYISEEDYKRKVEAWCGERRVQLDNDLRDTRDTLSAIKDMRDAIIQEALEAANKLNPKAKGYWVGRIKRIIGYIKWKG